MMRDAGTLITALRYPETALKLDGAGWTQLISIARAEALIGTLAYRLSNLPVPDEIAPVLQDARESAELAKRQALWEADCARRVLADFDDKVVLMKGTAYVAAELEAGIGRSIGDLDIMVDRNRLDEVEAALLDAGWEWVKPDPYDDAYYRDHMHELPPLIHRDRDRMIDVHHTILPLTAKPSPDAGAMMADAVRLDSGLYILSPEDMVCHCAAHLMADGDLAGGLRNLWDMHCLLGEFSAGDELFWGRLNECAAKHELSVAVNRAARFAAEFYGTEILSGWRKAGAADAFFRRRLLARDGYGRETRALMRQIFYIRSHWLRMPPLMLARHLWTKWRKTGAPR